MKLCTLITQFVAYRKSLGQKFLSNEYCLKSFCKAMGPDIEIDQISKDAVDLFLYGKGKGKGKGEGKVRSSLFNKHSVLLGFYQYAFTRGYTDHIPLPKILPKREQSFVPYIYSKEELRHLLKTALCYQNNKSCVDPHMIRVILILLYSTGLRLNEALSLTLGDINLERNLIMVRDSKFYQSRLIPIGDQLKHILVEYLERRAERKESDEPEAPLFVGNNGLQLKNDKMRSHFKRIRNKAGIVGKEGSTYPPRLHDLRHTFAVHHLTRWYQEKKDVQKLLPILSTYMGHRNLAHTTIYLTMTTDLLREAGKKFEKYAMGEQS
jgi:site-specific recombinase XerD